MLIFEYLLLILIYSIYGCNCKEFVFSQQKCSAMESYLQLSSSLRTYTVLSSQALFPPNTYYVPPYPITILNSSIDNICNASEITTDISNKILLVFTSNECTDYYKTYAAKQNGAIAVIIVLDDPDTVTSIPGSNQFNATIPTRGITQRDADFILRSILGGILTKAEFGCNNKPTSPLTLCALDYLGMYWFLDGEYIRQINQTYEEHDVWKKAGYYLNHYYIFLHTSNREDEWYWAITSDPTFQNDLEIRAFCAFTKVNQPSNCTLWKVKTGAAEPQIYKNLTISAELCNIEDSYICITSTQSSLAGLQGTYRLFNYNVPFWFREITDCDSTPGILVYESNNFELYDTTDGWIVAQCLNTNVSVNDYKMNPQLCSPWETLVDNTLDEDELIMDGTYMINTDKCVDIPSKACIIGKLPATSLCLSKGAIKRSYLEGTYVKTGVIGPKYNSVEYVRQIDAFNNNGELVPSYLLYIGEFDEDTPWWILSPVNMTEYIWRYEQHYNSVYLFGNVHCSLMNVANCLAPWNFYWFVSSALHSDMSFQITQGDCPPTTTVALPDYDKIYEYICINFTNMDAFKLSSGFEPNKIIGGYEIHNETNKLPYWTKPINDYTPDDETYIYFDELYGHWQISTQIYNDNDSYLLSICMNNALYPEQCNEWYDTVDGSKLTDFMSFEVNTCTYDDVLRKSCSAMHSWLQLSGVSFMEITLASSHTLFPPYKYRVKPVEIVVLDDSDNPCEINGIKTDIANKMVLTSTKTSLSSAIKCSDHYQAWAMQQNSAVAVLMASNDNTLSVIPDDDYLNIVTDIPMRGITLDAAEKIRDALSNGYIISGEFNCNDSFQYPLEICASHVGLEIYGNFELQRQNNYKRDKNGHPVWIRNGYSIYSEYANTYLYLHNGNADKHWYWAITMDKSLANDDDMIAYCSTQQTIENNSMIISPTDCKRWQLFGVNDSNMSTSSGICKVSDEYFCLSSQQSSLAGLSGTYRLYYDDEPVWFREWDACDTHPGVLTYSDGEFLLLDPMDGWIIAICNLGRRPGYITQKEFDKQYAFAPHLCTDWRSIIDSSLDDELLWDDSFQIDYQTDCANEIECRVVDYKPDTVCLHKNSVMHSFLEGEYVFNDVVGDKYHTKEYIRREKLYYSGTKIDVYLWFYGEVTDKYKWWIISSHNMSTGDAQNYSLVFGYNACFVGNPANCNGKWNFYWSGVDGSGSWHNDAEFDLIDGECPLDNTTLKEYDTQYDYICIDINENENYNRSRANIFKGGYKINKTRNEITGNTPFWVKPINDYTSSKMYIYYDEFYGYWQIGKGLSIETILICHNSRAAYPQNCGNWYDLYSNSLNDVISFRIETCSSADILHVTETSNALAIAISIIVIIAVLICCIIAYCIYKKLKNKQTYESFEDDHNEEFDNINMNTNDSYNETNDNDNDNNNNQTTEMSKKKEKKKRKKKKKKKGKKKGHTQLAIGTDEDDEYDGEHGALPLKTTRGATHGATTHGATHTHGGGYDMRTIQNENNNDLSDDHSNNLSDDSTTNDNDAILQHHHHNDNQPDHGIDDAEDGILMTKY